MLAADTGFSFKAVKRAMEQDDRERNRLSRNSHQRAVFAETGRKFDVPLPPPDSVN
jgi:hypothetical protein